MGTGRAQGLRHDQFSERHRRRPACSAGSASDVLSEAALNDKSAVDWKSAGIILDMSASVAVARFLCHDVETSARRISLFLNPSGTALTLLAEDTARSVAPGSSGNPALQSIVADSGLRDLLVPPATMRSGVGCRDVSTQIPRTWWGCSLALEAGRSDALFRPTTRRSHHGGWTNPTTL